MDTALHQVPADAPTAAAALSATDQGTPAVTAAATAAATVAVTAAITVAATAAVTAAALAAGSAADMAAAAAGVEVLAAAAGPFAVPEAQISTPYDAAVLTDKLQPATVSNVSSSMLAAAAADVCMLPVSGISSSLEQQSSLNMAMAVLSQARQSAVGWVGTYLERSVAQLLRFLLQVCLYILVGAFMCHVVGNLIHLD